MKHDTKKLLSFVLALIMIIGLCPITSYAAKTNVSAKYSKVSVEVGAQKQLKVKKAKGVTVKKVSYSSSNKKVAKVTKRGVITGKKTGKTTIKAKVTYYYGKATLTTTVKTKVTVKKCLHKKYGPWKVITPATCTAEGLREAKCRQCKEVKTETIPMTSHKYDNGVITKAPTCTEEGSKTYTCTVCGYQYTLPVFKTEHTWDLGKVTKEATCKDTGIKTYTCTKCNLTRESIIPTTTDHVWKNTYTVDLEPTETTAGKKSIHCSICDTIKPNSTLGIKKLPCEHEFDEGVVTKEPTCLESGIKTYTCTKCNDTKEELIKPTGHTPAKVIAKEPTYEEKGIENIVCEVCDAIIESNDIPKLTCGAVHDYVVDSTTPATCNTTGSIVKICSRCKKKKVEDIPMIAHNYVDGKCSMCGASQPKK